MESINADVPFSRFHLALNLMASTDASGNDQWWTWGVNNNSWTIQPNWTFSGSTGFFIDSSGKVGIGTATPAYSLDVAGWIRSSSGGIVFPDGSAQSTAYTPAVGIRIGTTGDPANYQVGIGAQTTQYNIDFDGYRDIQPDQIGARIAAQRFNVFEPNNGLVQNTGLAFFTNPTGIDGGTTDLVERMFIAPEGNVGIGALHSLAAIGSGEPIVSFRGCVTGVPAPR
jgi:hypothetical protein